MNIRKQAERVVITTQFYQTVQAVAVFYVKKVYCTIADLRLLPVQMQIQMMQTVNKEEVNTVTLIPIHG